MIKLQKRNIFLGIIISISSFILIFCLFYLGFFEGLESKALDLRFNIRGPRESSKDIVIVAIDEESVREENLGRFPWARDVHAKLVDVLDKAGAKVIAFDVLFPEQDKINKTGDQLFEEVIKRTGKVVLSFFGYLDAASEQKVFKTKTFPLKRFLENENPALIGFTNIFPEMDGVCRKISAYVGDTDQNTISYFLSSGLDKNGSVLYDTDNKMLLYFPLSVVTAAKYKGIRADEIIEKIPMDDYGEMVLNFAGGYQNYLYVSYCQVLSGKIKVSMEAAHLLPENYKDYLTIEKEKKYLTLTPGQIFKDKIVLVGSTAAGLYDKHPIPFSPAFPGVEVHANAIENILTDSFIKPPKTLPAILIMAFFAVLLGCILPNLSPALSSIMLFILILVWSAITQFLFSKYNIWIYYIAPLFTIVISYTGIMILKLMTEEKEKRKIKKTFSRYLSPKILEEILSDPSKQVLKSREENLTVLFSDIRGFTTMAETLPADKVISLLNEYLTKMTQVVIEYDGTLDKFIGDAVMAFWNAPTLQKNHPTLAIHCAIKMMEELAKLREEWKSRGEKHLIDIGIGVNTGIMKVGNIGSPMKMDYTLIGDNVNLGSRLEGLNKQYKTHIIISEATFEFVKDEIEYRELGVATVKGKEKGVKIYAVYGRKGDPFEKPDEELIVKIQ